MSHLLLVIGIAATFASLGVSRPWYRDEIPNGYNVLDGDGVSWPGVGHYNRGGGGPRNPFGVDFEAVLTWTEELCRKDSDGDGLSNGEELGDPECTWSSGQIPQFSVVTHPGFADVSRQDVSRDSCANYTAPTNSTTINVTFPDYNVLPVETTYVKLAFDLDQIKADDPLLDQNEAILITQFAPIIDEDLVVHHMLLFACTAPEVVGYLTPNHLGGMPCTEFLYGWAVGGGPFCFPQDIAVSVDTIYSYLILEIHYDNPTTGSSFFDSSGLALTATSQSNAGENTVEAGYIWVGEISSIAIPPGKSYWEVSATCEAPSELTFNLNVFASILHGHQIANKIFTVLDKAGTSEREMVACKPFYDFDLQEAIPNDVYTITGGDKLSVHCVYDSTSRTTATFGGDASADEMCLGIFFYYPKVDGTNCLGSAEVEQGDSVLDQGAVCTSAAQFALPFIPAPAWYSQHGFLMLFTWVVLFPAGIIVAMTQKRQGGSRWLMVHKGLLMLGLLLAIVAAIIAALNVTVHVASLHAQLGVAALALAIIQPISGLARPHHTPGAAKDPSRKAWEVQHQWTGRLAVGLAMGALYTGLGNFTVYDDSNVWSTLGYAVLVFFGLGVVLSAVYINLYRTEPDLLKVTDAEDI